MTPEHVRLVRTSWEQLRDWRLELSHDFYEALFRTAPHTERLFAGTGVNAQARKFGEMLAMVVPKLDDDAALEALLGPLGKRHANYGVKLRDYPAVGDALLAALQKQLGPLMTPDVRLAWAAAYDTVSSIMIRSLDPW